LVPPAADIGCIRCGVCCKKYQPFLSLEEAQLIADKLGVSGPDFKAEYADPRWPFDHSILLRHRNGACSFLKEDGSIRQSLCFIHGFKPACCRDWESRMDRADCREGLKAVWDLEIDISGQICGKVQKLEEFSRFLQTLE
jgi:Fe-S-cluster containining protein